MTVKAQSPGRKRNAAAPLGKRDASTSDKAIEKTGRISQTAAGPDGPNATAVSKTFKRRP
jgi:hypothetical protein